MAIVNPQFTVSYIVAILGAWTTTAIRLSLGVYDFLYQRLFDRTRVSGIIAVISKHNGP